MSDQILIERLKEKEQLFQSRSILPRFGIDFSSNDYLGFAQDPVLKERILNRAQDLWNGSTASRLIRGEDPIFDEVERQCAEFCDQPQALLFPSGYQANIGVLSALLRPGDSVYSDELNHASLIDGMRLSGAKKRIYSHLNLNHLEELLQKEEKSSASLRMIITESVFSMDGDQAPLRELVFLAEKYKCLMLVDEAHATGLFGKKGGGLVQEWNLSDRVFATLHPAGKALGVAGAWVSGGNLLKKSLIQFCRTFIYSTGPLPLLAASIGESLNYWKEVGDRRRKEVFETTSLFKQALGRESTSSSAIYPVWMGSEEVSLKTSRALRQNGYDVRAIRPPTVPLGTSRLRVTFPWREGTLKTEALKLAQLLSREARDEHPSNPGNPRSKLGKAAL